jgi:hypothetical protein
MKIRSIGLGRLGTAIAANLLGARRCYSIPAPLRGLRSIRRTRFEAFSSVCSAIEDD